MAVSPAFLILSIAIVAIPGPTNLFVLSQGTTGNFKRVVSALIGIAVANLLWLILSVFGVTALIVASGKILDTLRICGAFYLGYMGVKVLASPSIRVIENVKRISGRLVCFQAFLISMTNPKPVLFYSAFLPQFIERQESYFFDLLLLGILYIAIAMSVFLLYGICSHAISAKIGRFSVWLNRVVGTGLIASAIALFRWRPE